MKVVVLIGLIVFGISCSSTKNSSSTNEAMYKRISEIKNSSNPGFTFEANQVKPLRGSLRQLDYGYTVKVSEEGLISELPYFGRAQTATIGTNDSGLRFTSNKIRLNKKEGKNESFFLEYQFQDRNEPRVYSFQIFPNGSATLQVTSNQRDPISFSGVIK
jgi:hypothetical protein